MATFGSNRAVLCATQAKLHSMFCALFLKIALSAAELMSFGHTVGLLFVECRQNKLYTDKPDIIDNICLGKLPLINAASLISVKLRN